MAFDRAPRSERMVEARLTIVSDDGDYRAAQTGALGLDTAVNGVIEAGLPALGDRDLAAGWARGLLARAQASAETAAFALPPSLGFLEPGDAVTLDAGPQGRAWRIASLEGASVRRGALIGAPAGPALLSGPEPGAGEPSETVSRPVIALMDLPLGPNQTGRGGLLAAGWARPWPGELVIYAGADLQSATERVRLTAPGFLGTLLDPLAPGPEGRWDRANSVRLRLIDGALESRDRLAALRGEGLVAIETEAGWEAVSFQSATLESPGVWRLETLLRRLGGSPASPASAGARAVVLDGSAAVVPLTEDERGETLTFAAVPPGQSLTSAAARVVQAVWTGAELRPLSPVHLNAAAEGAAIRLSWIRRGRIGADGWGAAIPLGEEREAYRVELIDDAGAVRASHETDAATFLIADPAAVFPEGVTAASFRVAQIGAVYGAGAAAAAPLDPAGHL
ncbi:MAG: phage tail protein [Oceanicaulis sp.]